MLFAGGNAPFGKARAPLLSHAWLVGSGNDYISKHWLIRYRGWRDPRAGWYKSRGTLRLNSRAPLRAARRVNLAPHETHFHFWWLWRLSPRGNLDSERSPTAPCSGDRGQRPPRAPGQGAPRAPGLDSGAPGLSSSPSSVSCCWWVPAASPGSKRRSWWPGKGPGAPGWANPGRTRPAKSNTRRVGGGR